MLPVIPTITKHLFKRQHKAHEWKPNAFQVPTGRPYVHAWPGSNGTDSTEYWREGAFRNAETALVSQRTSFPSSVKRTEYFKFVCFSSWLHCTAFEILVPCSVQFSSVAQSCLTLRNPMGCSTPGFPVHHQFPEFTQNSCPLNRWCHPII